MPFADAGESLALEESMTQVRQTRRILDVPLVVVTRGRYDGLQRLPKETQARIKNAWEDMQADLVTLSSQGTQMVAANSDHYVHLGQPDIVVDAIRQVVAKARLRVLPWPTRLSRRSKSIRGRPHAHDRSMSPTHVIVIQ